MRRVACIVIAFACIGSRARDGGAQSIRASAGGTWEHYTFGTATAVDIGSLSLLTVPIGGETRLGDRVVFRVAGAWAQAKLTRADGTSSTLAGLTDTQASASVEIVPGAATVTALAAIPTGKHEFTFDEMFVAGAIAADLLPFAVTSWGTGGGAGLSVTLARPVGKYATGIRAGYVIARSFEPLTGDAFEYRPGDQLHIRAAVDRVIARTAKVSMQVGWQRFGADHGDERNLFQAGNRFQVLCTVNFAVFDGSAIIYAGSLHRGAGEFADPIELLPAQRLFFGGGGLRTISGGIVFEPSVDLRVLHSDGADRFGYTLGVGGSLEGSLGRAVLAPTVRARFGRIEAQTGEESGFTGFELGLAIRSAESRR